MNYEKPQEVSDTMLAFPAILGELLPPYDSIPDEFKMRGGKWEAWASDWFYKGLDEFPDAKDGVDIEMAKRHLSAVLSSFEPRHEHKIAGVAYLASQWLKKP